MEKFKIAEYSSLASQYLLKIYSNVNTLIDSLKNLESELYSEQFKDRYQLKIIDVEEKLIKDLEEYKEFISKLKILPIKFNKEDAIRNIDRFCKKIKEKIGMSIYEVCFEFYFILLINRDIAMSISECLGDKLVNYNEIEKLISPGFDEELKLIVDSYNKLISSSQNVMEKGFLESSHSSFGYGIFRFKYVFLSSISISNEFENINKIDLESSMTSALFLLISAYDKIIMAIGYKLDLVINPKTQISKVFEDIKNKDENLYNLLIKSDRSSIIEVARNLRNAETHRISNLSTVEIKGYLISIIKEILRSLKIYDNIK